MPKSREEIKHDPVTKEAWRNNRTQVGGLWFDPLKIQPLTDHILIQLDDETPPSKLIVAPDVAKNRDITTRIGTVIAVGPGKWKEKRNSEVSWVWNPLVFKRTTLKPGDRVAIGHYSDWESWFADFEGRGQNVVLCQEADVRLFIEATTARARNACSTHGSQ
jgi:co-chaperonin GroES (HSP10)